MFEAGEGWECWQIMREFPLRNWKKNTLNDFIRKLVEMKGLQPGSPERSADTCTEQWLDRISLVIRVIGGYIEHHLQQTASSYLCQTFLQFVTQSS